MVERQNHQSLDNQIKDALFNPSCFASKIGTLKRKKQFWETEGAAKALVKQELQQITPSGTGTNS